jgi:hypothetical protein
MRAMLLRGVMVVGAGYDLTCAYALSVTSVGAIPPRVALELPATADGPLLAISGPKPAPLECISRIYASAWRREEVSTAPPL